MHTHGRHPNRYFGMVKQQDQIFNPINQLFSDGYFEKKAWRGLLFKISNLSKAIDKKNQEETF